MACFLEGNRMLVAGQSPSFVERIFGASRIAFSQSLFEQADIYFHKGVSAVPKRAFTNSVYVRVRDVIQPRGHAHASGYTVSEIMPWLQFSTRMDPRNITAYLTMAYWLRSRLKRPDLAEQVLLEAQRCNPHDYRVFNERARLAFQRHDDRKAALLLDAALRTWPSDADPEDGQVILDLAQIYSRQGFLYQMQRKPEQALNAFREVLKLRPGNMMLAERVQAMEQGVDFSDADRETWEALFGESDHDDHDHDHDHDHVEGHSHRHAGCMTGGLH